MLRKLLIATALLAASGAALAHNTQVYGRVVSVEPRVSIAFGTGYHDGFRVLYESGGQRYWTHSQHRPGHVIVLPPQHHRVKHVYHHYDHYGHRGGWDKHRKHGRDDWRDDRRDHHNDRRDHRRHGRD